MKNIVNLGNMIDICTLHLGQRCIVLAIPLSCQHGKEACLPHHTAWQCIQLISPPCVSGNTTHMFRIFPHKVGIHSVGKIIFLFEESIRYEDADFPAPLVRNETIYLLFTGNKSIDKRVLKCWRHAERRK